MIGKLFESPLSATEVVFTGDPLVAEEFRPLPDESTHTLVEVL